MTPGIYVDTVEEELVVVTELDCALLVLDGTWPPLTPAEIGSVCRCGCLMSVSHLPAEFACANCAILHEDSVRTCNVGACVEFGCRMLCEQTS